MWRGKNSHFGIQEICVSVLELLLANGIRSLLGFVSHSRWQCHVQGQCNQSTQNKYT